LGGLMAELAKKKTSAGDSAATGLKTVSKDQQTWRKEFAGGDAPAPKAAPKPKAAVKKASKVATKPPVFEYDDMGYVWKVEYQVSHANGEEQSDGHLKIVASLLVFPLRSSFPPSRPSLPSLSFSRMYHSPSLS